MKMDAVGPLDLSTGCSLNRRSSEVGSIHLLTYWPQPLIAKSGLESERACVGVAMSTC